MESKAVQMHGRVTGHLLKHPEKSDSGPVIGSGPTTVQVTLEDGEGHRCKAEMVVDGPASAFPIGGFVRVELELVQMEMLTGVAK